jgi:hypothetical protein
MARATKTPQRPTRLAPSEKAALIDQAKAGLLAQDGVTRLLDTILTECEGYEPVSKALTPLDRLDQLQRQIERAIEDVQDDETGSAYRARLVTIAARAIAAIRQVDAWQSTREVA